MCSNNIFLHRQVRSAHKLFCISLSPPRRCEGDLEILLGSVLQRHRQQVGPGLGEGNSEDGSLGFLQGNIFSMTMQKIFNNPYTSSAVASSSGSDWVRATVSSLSSASVRAVAKVSSRDLVRAMVSSSATTPRVRAAANSLTSA